MPGAGIDPAWAADPGDPVQGLDDASELRVEPLDVDAQSIADVEAAQDLADLEVELDQIIEDDAAVLATQEVAPPRRERDADDLHGAHTAPLDRRLPDDDRAFNEGQNWVEALEASAVEYGPGPERELDDLVDGEDVLKPPHGSHTRDTPIADLGSGGRRGL